MINPIGRERVVERIAAIRTALADAELSEMTRHFVSIGDAGQAKPAWDALPPGLKDFLNVANGMRCRSFIVYNGGSSVEKGRFYANMIDDGGSKKWHAIGEYETVPVFMDHKTGGVWFTPDGAPEDFMYMPMKQIAPDIWSFIGWYVTGPGYLDPMFGIDDDWAHFLRDHGFLDLENPE